MLGARLVSSKRDACPSSYERTFARRVMEAFLFSFLFFHSLSRCELWMRSQEFTIYLYLSISIYYLSLPIYHLSRISQSISIYLSIYLSIFSSSYLYLSLSHLHIYLSIPPYRGQSPPSLPGIDLCLIPTPVLRTIPPYRGRSPLSRIDLRLIPPARIEDDPPVSMNSMLSVRVN